MKIILSNSNLFIKKALALLLATFILIPLIHYKLMIPAIFYIIGLIILHLLFFYLYFTNVPWQEIGRNKKGLVLRVVSVGFLIYILSILKLDGNEIILFFRIATVFIIHLLILLFLMLIKIEPLPFKNN